MLVLTRHLTGMDRERYLEAEKLCPFVKDGAEASLDSIGPQIFRVYRNQEEALRLTRMLWKKYLAACIAHGIEPQFGAESSPPPA